MYATDAFVHVIIPSADLFPVSSLRIFEEVRSEFFLKFCLLQVEALLRDHQALFLPERVSRFMDDFICALSCGPTHVLAVISKFPPGANEVRLCRLVQAS